MPIKTFATKEEVPEAQRDAAMELKDGKWAADEVDPTLGEKGERALAAAKETAKTEEKLRKAAEKERDELKLKADAAAKGITEVELQKIRDAEVLARKPLEDEAAALKAENRKLKLWDRVEGLGLKSGWMKDRVRQAKKDLEGRVDLTEDGKSIVVKDLVGNLTTETIEDFLAKTYKAEASFFYEGSGAAGSGSVGSDGGGTDNGATAAIADGKAAAAKQKQTRESNKLAFT